MVMQKFLSLTKILDLLYIAHPLYNLDIINKN